MRRSCRVLSLLGLGTLMAFLRSSDIGASPEVSGEFREDETCVVQTPFGKWTGRTFYNYGGVANMAPSGYDVHMLWCRFPTPSDSSGLSSRRRLALFFPVRARQPLRPGRYAIVDSAIFGNKPFTVSASVSDLKYAGGSSDPPRVIDMLSLTGISGELELTRIDSSADTVFGIRSVEHPHVIGRFTMKTRDE